jgi:AraC-like DNA-binding protein
MVTNALTPLLAWLFVLAMGQTVFLSVSLLSARQPEMRTANRLLSALLLTFAAILGHAWLGLNHLYRQYPHSAMAIVTLGLAVGPLLYLYLHAMLSDRPLGRRALLHFVPFGVATLAMLPFYLRPAADKLAWMRSLDGMPWYLGVAAVVKLVVFLIYLRASYRLMRRVPPDSELTRGLHQLMQIWFIGGLLSIASLAMELASPDLPISADAVGGVALMLFVFATAFMAMRLPLGYRPQTLPPASESAPRYAGKQLSTADRDAFVIRLSAAMEQDHAYRNGELKLEELAGQVAMTPHELSQLINEHYGTNFSDYLNRHRVDALKTALHDANQAGVSILDLALACGFNSKSAMNRVFKKQTGQTPGEFRAGADAAAQAASEATAQA